MIVWATINIACFAKHSPQCIFSSVDSDVTKMGCLSWGERSVVMQSQSSSHWISVSIYTPLGNCAVQRHIGGPLYVLDHLGVIGIGVWSHAVQWAAICRQPWFLHHWHLCRAILALVADCWFKTNLFQMISNIGSIHSCIWGCLWLRSLGVSFV